MNEPVKIAVVDDHTLYRKGLIKLIRSISPELDIFMEASDGKEFIDRLSEDQLPDLAIIDIDMPVMSGFEVAEYLKEHYPSVQVLVVTMLDDEQSLIKMIRAGVKGYLGKDVEPDELKKAIHTISAGQFYYTEALSGKLVDAIRNDNMEADQLNDREAEFIHYCCSELTYKEIADRMFLSPKTIDGYRANLFERFEVKSRVGLVLFALKRGWVEI